MTAKKKRVETQTLQSRPFWPGFLLEELSVLILFLGLVLLLASVLHPSQVFESDLERSELRGLESPADPFNTPPRVLPEWYFLATFELLKLMAPWVVTILIGLFVVCFMFVPFIDGFLSRFNLRDWIMRLFGIGIIFIFLYFTLRGMELI
ncbi:MAG: hypothetical protein ACE5IO_03670 [Thermoplasmata archaeon]